MVHFRHSLLYLLNYLVNFLSNHLNRFYRLLVMPNMMVGTLDTKENHTVAVLTGFSLVIKEHAQFTTIKCYNSNSIALLFNTLIKYSYLSECKNNYAQFGKANLSLHIGIAGM